MLGSGMASSEIRLVERRNAARAPSREDGQYDIVGDSQPLLRRTDHQRVYHGCTVCDPCRHNTLSLARSGDNGTRETQTIQVLDFSN